MAKKKSQIKQERERKEKDAGDLGERKLYQTLDQHRDDSDRYISEVRNSWDEKEALLIGTLKDEASQNSTKSQVFDPRLSTILLERAARVMGQLPAGKSMAVSKDDKGKNAMMNLCIDKYAIPNANSQFDYLIKSRLLDVYSMVYGVMFALVDWRVDERSGYVGPDYWLIPIRDAFPQAGAVSLQECEHFQVSTLQGIDFFKQRKDDKSWNHMDEIIHDLKEKRKGKSRSDMDSDRKSHVDEKRHPDSVGNTVEVITEYRIYGGKDDKGEWITYSPDYPDWILRKIDNPHENGELPIVAKYAFPLIDSIYGIGEFERGKTLQYAINSLINLYLDGVKRSLFPPVIVDKDKIVPSSIKWGPAAKWLKTGPGPISEAVRELQTNPQGLQTFQSTYSFLNAALLNQAGTTDTATSDTTDPGLGKTPQALKMLAARESSRDNWDRFMMEKTQEDILRKFVNLIAKKQEKPIKMRLFEAEMKEIAQVYPDAIEMYSSGERGEVTIDSKQFDSIDFDYQIVSGSTSRIDEELQVKNLTQLMSMLLDPNQGRMIIEEMRKKGKDVDIAELFTRWVSSTGITDWDKIITEYSPEEDPALQQQQMQQAVSQFQDPEIQAFAQQLMGNAGQIPARPQGGGDVGY